MKIHVVTGVLLSVMLTGCVSTETASITPPADMTPPADVTPSAGDPAPDPTPNPDPSPADPAPVTVVTQGRFLKWGESGSNTTEGKDRTETAIDIEITANTDGTVDFKPKTTMTGGTAIPAETGMTLGRITAYSDTYESSDTFLTQVGISPDMGIGIYRSKFGYGTGLVGYSIDGDRTQNMPTSGSATFSGAAALTVVQDYIVRGGVGTTSLTADFGAGEISGRISDIMVGLPDDTAPFAEPGNSRALGADLMLGRAAIVGNTYRSNDLSLVYEGDTAPVSGTVNHAEYSGGFFGSGAAGTGGTLHYKGTNMGAVIGNVEIVGGFHGNR